MGKLSSSQLIPQTDLRVRIGSTVLVLLETGATLTLTIKTPRETDPARGIVSDESPIGKALLNKREGEMFQYAVGNQAFGGKLVKIYQ